MAKLIVEGIAPATFRGGDRRSAEFQTSATHLNENTAEHIVARLKRSHPNLADQVIAGKISANAAARQAGIRKPRIVLTSPQSIAQALRRHLDDDAIAELVELLQQT